MSRAERDRASGGVGSERGARDDAAAVAGVERARGGVGHQGGEPGGEGGHGLWISEALAELDLDRIHGWLATAYWCVGVPRAVVEKAARGSMVFGVFAPGAGQIAYARVVSDRATFAWLCDVIVDPAWRGRGVGVFLVDAIVTHPELQGLRRFLLATLDAHGLYRRFGFAPTATPDRWMERLDRDVYTRALTSAATPPTSTSTP